VELTLNPKLAPYILVKDAPGFIRFLEEGLGGRLTYEIKSPDRGLSHAEVRISDSVVMFAETPPGIQPFPAMLHFYVPDADAAYDRALKAGATSLRPPTDQPDGDRRGGVLDAWGNQWWFTAHGNRS